MITRKRVTLIGAGGIGSPVGLALIKMGFDNLHVYDGDKVATENLGTQMYGRADLNCSKSTQLAARLHGLMADQVAPNTVPVSAHANYTGAALQGLVISAVDSMKTRKMIWAAQKNNPKVDWFIDARMGGEYAVIYAINPNDDEDIATYERSLFDDKEAYQDPCTASATVFTGLLIGGWIGKTVRDVLAGNPRYPRVTRWDIRNNELNVYHKEDALKSRVLPKRKSLRARLTGR